MNLANPKRKWKANKLPVIGCPVCISDGKVDVHGNGMKEVCTYCNGKGWFPANMNRARKPEYINEQLKKEADGNRSEY